MADWLDRIKMENDDLTPAEWTAVSFEANSAINHNGERPSNAYGIAIRRVRNRSFCYSMVADKIVKDLKAQEGVDA